MLGAYCGFLFVILVNIIVCSYLLLFVGLDYAFVCGYCCGCYIVYYAIDFSLFCVETVWFRCLVVVYVGFGLDLLLELILWIYLCMCGLLCVCVVCGFNLGLVALRFDDWICCWVFVRLDWFRCMGGYGWLNSCCLRCLLWEFIGLFVVLFVISVLGWLLMFALAV